MKSHYYSPQIDRDLVTALYHEARARRMPMTKLASQLLREALRAERTRQDSRDSGFKRPAAGSTERRRRSVQVQV
ncbi:MAG: hypothetical protein ACR2NX_07635 [Chthoniobacterales bacterium]